MERRHAPAIRKPATIHLSRRRQTASLTGVHASQTVGQSYETRRRHMQPQAPLLLPN